MKIGNMEIGYVSDTGKDYQNELDEAKTLKQLRDVTQKYYPFAWDADAMFGNALHICGKDQHLLTDSVSLFVSALMQH